MVKFKAHVVKSMDLTESLAQPLDLQDGHG
jgi:hypothetical protein